MRSIWLVRLAASFALLVTAQHVAASEPANGTQESAISASTESLFAPQPKVRPKPYSALFKAPDLRTTTLGQPLLAPRPETSKPRVVCGMTLIPMDPNVDPKIYVEPRRSGTRYSIRAIPPPLCR